MGWLKSIGRGILGYSDAHKKRQIVDQRAYRNWKEDSASFFKGQYETLESWRGNAYLRDLMASPSESRRVARETEAIRGGVGTRKRGATDSVVRNRLGSSFLAKQIFAAEETGAQLEARSVGEQVDRSNQIGAATESQYAQSKSSIDTAKFVDDRNREDFRLAKNARLFAGRDANRKNMTSRGIALGAMVAGAAMGGMGVGGLGASAGTAATATTAAGAGTAAGGWGGAMIGASMGASVGGMLGGNQAFGQGMSQAFGGAPVAGSSGIIGGNPLLAYALGMAQNPANAPTGNNSITEGNQTGLVLPPGPSTYNKFALEGARGAA